VNWAKALGEVERGDGRIRRRDDERGASLVEFAFIVPVLALLVFGIIDFGLAINDSISQRQGVRDAGRQVAVGSWSDDLTCGDAGAPIGGKDVQSILCLAKKRIDLKESSTSVYVKLGTDGYTVGAPMAVCSAYPLHSSSGFFGPLLNGRYLKSKVVMRIETVKSGATIPAGGGGETDPTGNAWSWCTT
jgi:Flp pilus assembly protein TadG